MTHPALPALVVAAVLSAGAHADNGDRIHARLHSYQEVPAASSTARGSFEGRIVGDSSITYELRYTGLESSVTQAHIHFGQRHVNGGIAVFLCSNLGNGPAGTQACPTPSATITGTITAASVIGPAGQGLAAGEFNELLRAIRSGIAYVNVHSVALPGGEIRGQVKGGDDD
jgi:hypothetical protein